jgi:hypothetical protein
MQDKLCVGVDSIKQGASSGTRVLFPWQTLLNVTTNSELSAIGSKFCIMQRSPYEYAIAMLKQQNSALFFFMVEVELRPQAHHGDLNPTVQYLLDICTER